MCAYVHICHFSAYFILNIVSFYTLDTIVLVWQDIYVCMLFCVYCHNRIHILSHFFVNIEDTHSSQL